MLTPADFKERKQLRQITRSVRDIRDGRNPNLSFAQIKEQIQKALDSMGDNSARAQDLPYSITTLGKFVSNGSQKLLILASGRKFIGFLKFGFKRLFLENRFTQKLTEANPLCVLDFYVHESQQRNGFGKLLFDMMLLEESTTADKLALDKPSFKMQAFLLKHFGLKDHLKQNNNFVVFDSFWPEAPPRTFEPASRMRTSGIQNTKEQNLSSYPYNTTFSSSLNDRALESTLHEKDTIERPKLEIYSFYNAPNSVD